MHERKRFHFLSTPMIALYIVITILVLVYFGLSIFFFKHYLPNTIVSGVKAGFRSSAYLEKTNEELAESFAVIVTDRKGNRFQIHAMDISYTYINQGEEEVILESQNPFAWPLTLFSEQVYTLDVSVKYDADKLSEAVDRLQIFEEDYIEQPVDAYIQLEEEGYKIIPEVMGCVPIADQIKQEVANAFETSTAEIKLSDKCYVSPNYYSASEQITQAATKMDGYLNSTITYDIEGVDESFSKKEIMKMITLSETFEVSIKESVIERYVQSLATKYNTYGDKREFTTSKGDVIIIGGGDYGWVINKTKEAQQILQDLEGGVPVTREPVYEQRALQSGLNDIGDTYIEVDYTNQHMWYYENGELILESDLVSGSLRTKNGSPDGVFKIVYKQRNAVLRGEDYASPVSYFMPFAYNVGFHDATWRSTFGGTIYKNSGSHGCINLPPDFAKELYENVEVGTPVIAYYREPVELTAENAKISNAYSYVKPVEDKKTTN